MSDEITISKEIQFDAGHRVPNHGGQCRNPHGHRYRVEAMCSGRIIDRPGDPAEGMLVDFKDLKTLLTEHVHDVLDHGFIVYNDDHRMIKMLENDADQNPNDLFKVIVFPYIPTAENIARWIWGELVDRIETQYTSDLWLSCVKVWETPTSMAMYDGS